MFDVAIQLPNRPGSLAEMGETLGRAGISIEGGGVWVVDCVGVAHFLFEDGDAACDVLKAANFEVLACQRVLVQRLRQDEPGQLGKLTRMIADAGVNITVMYSDHDNQLILVVDDHKKGLKIAQQWESANKGRQE